MKAIGNPVEVEYAVIREVGGVGGPEIIVDLDWGGLLQVRALTAEMTARYVPEVGDYFVQQSDGYEYVNPKAVFERKYSPAGSDAATLEADKSDLANWVYGILAGKPVPAGDFLKRFALAVAAADGFNYAILRPTMLQLKAKYPKYAKS